MMESCHLPPSRCWTIAAFAHHGGQLRREQTATVTGPILTSKFDENRARDDPIGKQAATRSGQELAPISPVSSRGAVRQKGSSPSATASTARIPSLVAALASG